MKTILSILLILLGTVITTAQEKEKRTQLPAAKIAELQTKRMTLYLDLNDKQQKEVLKINRKLAEKRKQQQEQRKIPMEKNKKYSDEEHFNDRSAILDEQIAIQREMKTILNDEQYQQWRKMRAKTHKRVGKTRKMRKKDMKVHKKN